MLLDEKVPTNGTDAEQAIIRRYGLVRERRSTATRLAEVQEALHAVLKDLFTTRFAAGPEAAAAFEQSTRKLADIASENTQLHQKLAGLEQQLQQLSWVKGELEV